MLKLVIAAVAINVMIENDAMTKTMKKCVAIKRWMPKAQLSNKKAAVVEKKPLCVKRKPR